MNTRQFLVKIFIPVLLIAAFLAAFFLFNNYIYNEKQAKPVTSFKDAEYSIAGERVVLKNGVSETEAAPGSASKITTRYFGNELHKDINGDGKEDVVFLITQTTGGTGVFYYLVAAIITDNGYLGSEAVYLGDRIAPQSVHSTDGKMVVATYADRKPGEDFSVAPSVAKSITLKLNPLSLVGTVLPQFGEVVQEFEGEADPARMKLTMKPWVWVSTLYNDERVVTPKKSEAFVLTFVDETHFSAKTDCNRMTGTYSAKNGTILFGSTASTKMYCEGSQEVAFGEMLRDTSGYHFTSKGELIFDLKFDSGNVTFR